MNNTNGRLNFVPTIDNAELQRGANEASRLLHGIGSSAVAESARIDNSFNGIGKGLAMLGGTTALAMLGKQLLTVRGEFQQLDVAFTTMLGSKEKADKLMGQIVETAAKTPFTLTEVAQGAKQLLAYQVAAEEVNDTVIRLGNIASGVSVPISRLILAYGQVKAKGRLMGDDLRQFSEAGVPMIHELAKVMGVADNQIQKMVANGIIGFPEVQKVIGNLTNEGGMFFNLMEKQAGTITGQLSNLKDALDRAFNGIGQSNEGIISGGILGLTGLVKNYEEVGKVLTTLVGTYGAYKVAIMTLSAVKKVQMAMDAVQASLLTGNVASTITLTAAQELQAISTVELTAAQKLNAVVAGKVDTAYKLLNGTMLANPIVLATTLIVGLGVAMWALHDSTTAAERAQKSLNDILDKQKASAENESAEIKKNIAVIKDETSTRNQKQTALQTLQSMYPSIFAGLDAEKLKHLDLAKAMKQVNDEIEKKNGADDRTKLSTINKLLSDTKGGWNFSQMGNARDLLGDKIQWYDPNDITGSGLRKQLEAERDALVLKKNQEQQAKKDADFAGLTSKQKLEYLKAENKQLEQKRQEFEKLAVTLKNPIFDKNGIITNGSNEKSFSNFDVTAKNIDQQIKKNNSKIYEIEHPSSVNKKETEEERKAREAREKKEQEIAQRKADATLKLANNAIKDGFEERQAKISNDKAMNATLVDGFLKKQALIDIEHQQELLNIDKRAQELVERQQESERLVWESKGKKGVFVPSTVNAGQLSASNASQIGTLTNTENEVYKNNQKALLDDLRKQYQSFVDEKAAINKKYDDDEKALRSDANRNDPNQNAELEKLKKYRTDALDALDRTVAEKEITFRGFLDNIVYMGLDELVTALDTAKRTLASAESTLSDENKAVLRAKIKALEDEIKAAKTNNGKDSEADVTTNNNLKTWSETATVIAKVNSEISSMVDNIDGLDDATKAGFKAVSNIAGAVVASISGIVTLSKVGTAAVVGVERASVILTIISAGILIVTTIMNLIDSANEKAKREKQALIDLQQQEYFGLINYNEELRKKYDWTKKIGETETAYQERKKEELERQKAENLKLQKELEDKLKKQAFKSGTVEGVNWEFAGYKNTTQHDIWSSLSTKSFDEIGELAAQGKLSADGMKLYEALKKAKEEGVDIEKQWNSYVEDAKKALTGTTEDSIANSIVEGFKAGKSSAEDFATTFGEMMQSAMQSALQTKIKDDSKKFYEEFAKLSEDGLTETEKATLKASWDSLVAKAQDEAKGIESLTGSSMTNATRTATSKGMAGLTQDQGTELNGRFTAMQGSMFSIAETIKMLQANSASMLEHLAGINVNTAGTKSNTDRLEAIQNGIETLNLKGVILRQ